MADTYPDITRLKKHQIDVLQDPTRFKTLIWHRRARKTTTSIIELTRWALAVKGVYWHVFPTYREGKDAIWRDPNMLFSIIPEHTIEKKNDQELVVYFKNGSILQLKGADKPDTLRGAGPIGMVLDEFATMKGEAWSVVEPILRANKGWAWFVGTPKGKNHLHRMYQHGLGKNKEWKSWLLKASTSGIIPHDQLEESRNTAISQAFYNQEWECEFLEGVGSVFRNVRDIMTAKPEAPIADHNYVMGVDLAKVQDYTVIAVYDRENNYQVYQDRFQTLEWPYQKKKILSISKMYNNALTIIDATGLGDPISDDLQRAGVPIEPYKITAQSKKELIEKLSIWIEQHKLAMIPMEETIFELDNFSYEIGPTGYIRYNAPPGLHDDIVIAHALAISALSPVYQKKQQGEPTRVQQEFQRRLHNYENTIDYSEW